MRNYTTSFRQCRDEIFLEIWVKWKGSIRCLAAAGTGAGKRLGCLHIYTPERMFIHVDEEARGGRGAAFSL